MKLIAILLLLIFVFGPARAQQSVKADDALLLEYYQNQRFGDALDYLKKTYPEPVSDLKVLASLAYTSQMSGKLADAESYYQRIYAKDSTNVSLLFNLGNINIRRGNNAKALVYYQKLLVMDSTNFNVYKQLATLSYNMGSYAPYINYLKKASQLNPIDPDVASDLAIIYINLKAYQMADSVISRAMKVDTGNLVLLHQKAIIYYRLEKFPMTITLCQQLNRAGASANDVNSMLGTSYFMVKKYKDCIATFDTLEKNKTATETSYYYTAMSYKALGEQEKSILYFNKAINEAISPNVDTYYSEMADSYEKLHRLKNAVISYQKSLLYNDKPMITYYMLANLYDLKLKNKHMAARYYRKYVNTNPPEKQKSYVDYARKRLKALTH